MYRDNKEKQEVYTASNTGQTESFSQDISAFGKVKVDIARCLTKTATLELAWMLKKFHTAQRDALGRSENPGKLFVECSVEMGYITPKGAGSITKALEELNINGPAEKIRETYEKHKEQLEAENESNERESLQNWAESTSDVSHSSKRTLDDLYSEEKDASLEGSQESTSVDMRKQEKLPKVTHHGFTNVTVQNSQYVFIQHLFNPSFSEVDKSNLKARCIGVAFEISNDPPEPKLLYVSRMTGEMKNSVNQQCYKLRKGSNILNRRCYNLSSCYSVTVGQYEGILIGPEAEASMVSRHLPQFRWINYQTLEEEEPFDLTSSFFNEEGVNLPVFKVASVKYSMPDGQTVFNISGVVKEMVETHFRSSPRIIFKLIDDTSGEFLDVSIFKQYFKRSWLKSLREDESVTLSHFKTHRSATFQSNTNMLVGTQDSDVEPLGNDKFDELKKFDLGLSEEGVIMTVNPVRPYPACPFCYKKLNEDNRCPTCKEVFSEEDLARQFLVKLEILRSTSQETIDGVVFKECIIDALRNYDESTLDYVNEDIHSLDVFLIDKKVRYVFRYNEEMDNVFSKLKIVGDADI